MSESKLARTQMIMNGVGGSLYRLVYFDVRDYVPASECTVERQRLKSKARED